MISKQKKAASISNSLMWQLDSVTVHRPPALSPLHTAPHPSFEASEYKESNGSPWDIHLNELSTLLIHHLRSMMDVSDNIIIEL